MTALDIDIANLIKKRIRELDSTCEIIVYGSHARSEATSHSDWDILILIDAENTLSIEQKYRHHLLEVELSIGSPISVFVFSKNEWEEKYSISSLNSEIEAEGIQIS